jgi:hypothetical protein
VTAALQQQQKTYDNGGVKIEKYESSSSSSNSSSSSSNSSGGTNKTFVSRQRLGAATVLNTVFRNLGSAIAPTVAGTILTNYNTYVYFNAPHGPVYFSAPSRGAYVNIDIAMFISALVLILMSYCRSRDIIHNK